MSASNEEAAWFSIGGDAALAILHSGQAHAALGMLVVVGGPQYRVGSHRQYVLLARAVAEAGFPVLRFDCRGMGDSAGVARPFTALDDDIRAAIDELTERTGVRRVVIWGLCDAASAALMYAHSDERVAALIVLNPWVHSLQIEAQVRLKGYYLARLRSREFWAKLIGLRLNLADSLQSLVGYARRAVAKRDEAGDATIDYVDRMLLGLRTLHCPLFVILSGDDLTAQEFIELLRKSPSWRAQAEAKTRGELRLEEANHTFARSAWRELVEGQTVRWLREIESDLA